MRLMLLSPVAYVQSPSELDLQLKPIERPEDFLFSLGVEAIKMAR